MDDGDMRRAEEVVILERLPGVRHPVAARDAQRVVELKAALAPALLIDPEIFARRREIMVILRAGRGLGIDRLANRSLASPLAINTCQGWLLHHDAVRCAATRTR